MTNASTFRSSFAVFRERSRAVITEVNLHLAGVIGLSIIMLALLCRLLLTWEALSVVNTQALEQQRQYLKNAEIAALPLASMDIRLASSNASAIAFYKDRLPATVSQIATELGNLTRSERVQLVTARYEYSPIAPANVGLTRVQIDAGVSGEYTNLVRLINDVERDRLFFSIANISFVGTPAGQVSLRVHLDTYLPSEL